MFGLFSWDFFSFLKGDREGIDLREWKDVGGEIGMKEGSTKCGQDVIYETRVKIK